MRKKRILRKHNTMKEILTAEKPSTRYSETDQEKDKRVGTLLRGNLQATITSSSFFLFEDKMNPVEPFQSGCLVFRPRYLDNWEPLLYPGQHLHPAHVDIPILNPGFLPHKVQLVSDRARHVTPFRPSLDHRYEDPP